MGEIAINQIHNIHKQYRQVNLVNAYIDALPIDISTNTEIGGVASAINTPASLASKLGIDVSRITNFSIVGSDIKCKITGSYTAPVESFSNTETTYYKGYDACVGLDTGVFQHGSVSDATLKTVELPFVTQLNGIRHFARRTGIKRLYIPRATKLGETVGNNEIFFDASFYDDAIIYVHPSLATNNAGGEDGDIVYARSKGAAIRFVSSFVAPITPTLTSIGTIYGTAAQINFSQTSGSTNAIEYYEVYVNGVKKNNITASGQYVMALTPSTLYNVTFIAVDVFYNKSVVSNSLSFTTNTTSAVPASGLVAYYKLDEIIAGVAVDTQGGYNLTNTGVSINQSGKVGQSYQATAGSQYLNTSSFPVVSTTIAFNLWVYRTGTGTGTVPQLIGTGSYPTNAGMSVLITPSGDVGWVIKQDYNNWSNLTNIPLNTWTMVTVTFDGSNVKTYINSVLKRTNAKVDTLGSTTLFRMFATQGNEGSFVGKIDEAAVYTSLNQNQIDLLYNNGNGITL